MGLQGPADDSTGNLPDVAHAEVGRCLRTVDRALYVLSSAIHASTTFAKVLYKDTFIVIKNKFYFIK